MKTDELRIANLRFEVKQRSSCYRIDVEPYLGYAGIASRDDISEIQTSTDFPPEKYNNTGRTRHMPSSYLCMGSASYEFLLKNGEGRALSLAFFHDTTERGGTSEVNAYIYGWPVNIAEPDYTKMIPCHSLRDDAPINVTIARGTPIEKEISVRTPSKKAS